jgi:phosphatidylserine/phosphatidylglycerophosphate/cardiolipin synthase-like enzyme
MKKLVTLLFVVIISSQFIFAQKTTNWPMNGKIRVYFTRKVNTSVSSGVNAVYLNNTLNDTLVAYINRAQTSIDFCVYDYSDDAVMTPVENAITSAHNRGVTIRWIYDSSEVVSGYNTALAKLPSGVKKLASPVANSTYGTSYIMHDKFVIFDAASSTNATVWTGSPDWGTYQFNYCFNNVVVIQDQPLAQAYTTEFNQMWGSTNATYNKANSKFGVKKTAATTTSFTIGGSTVELYFSPMGQTQTHIINAMNTANTDLYFGIYTFSTTYLSAPIITLHNNGIFTAGIVDSWSNGNTCVTNLTSSLGSDFKIYTESNDTIYHNKFAIIDPSNTSSDPQVVTGSHNWSAGANSYNDENTLIIHNAVVANMYYQEFYQNFIQVGGGSLPLITGVNEINPTDGDIYIYPNPVAEGSPVYLNINSSLNLNDAKLVIYDILGNKLKEISHLNSQQTAINCGLQSKGMYFYQLMNNNEPIKSGKFIVR